MSNVGYSTLQVIPTMKDAASNLTKGISGPSAKAGDEAGKNIGSRMRSGILAPLRGIGGPIAAALAGAAMFSFFKDAVGEAREGEKVGKITAATIKATGGAAKITADQVGDLATSLSNKTGMDDEAIQSGANLLLTFKNVRNEVGEGANIFDRATAAATDLSAAGFGDLNGASKQLGKALNDPIKGMTALSRSGVTFTAQQQKQVKALMKTGDILGAQKIILGEVESQVGGVAAASATAGEKATVAFGNMKESIGTALLPVLDRLATFFAAKIAPAVTGFVTTVVGGVKAFRAAWTAFDGDITSDGFAGTMERIAFITRTVFTEVRGGITAFAAAWSAFDGDVTSSGFPGFMEKAAFAIRSVYEYLKPLVVGAAELAVTIGKRVVPVLVAFGTALASGIIANLQSVGRFIGQNKTLFESLAVVVGAGIGMWALYSGAMAVASGVMKGVAAVTRTYAAVQAVLNAVLAVNPIFLVVAALVAIAAGLIYAYKHSEKFRNIVDGAFKAVKTAVVSVVNFFKTLPGNISRAVGDLGPLLKAKGVALLKGLVTGYLSIWVTSARWFRALPGVIFRTIGSVIGTLAGKGRDLIYGLARATYNAATSLLGWWGRLPRVILSRVGGVASTLAGKGRDLLTGMIRGATGAVGGILNLFRTLPGRIVGALGSLGGVLSGAGRALAQGFINGIGNMVGSAASKARELASAAKNAITGALGIFSPSKVTTKLGMYTGLGFVKGLASMVKAVARQATDMATAAVPGLAGASGLAIRSASASGTVPTASPTTDPATGRPVNVNVYADDPLAAGRQVGRYLANQGV